MCICSFVFLLVSIIGGIQAIDWVCRYDEDTDWSPINDVYFCDLNESLAIPNPNTDVTSVTGDHADQKSLADVKGFRAYNKTLHYLPQGLEKYFVADKIIFIAIWGTGLKEIRQIDLAPYTKMKFFSAFNNDVQVIEQDLFKFNKNIEFISLSKNKIKFIDGNAFQNLNHLVSLYLDDNECISKSSNGGVLVIYFIKEIRQKCGTYV